MGEKCDTIVVEKVRRLDGEVQMSRENTPYVRCSSDVKSYQQSFQMLWRT